MKSSLIYAQYNLVAVKYKGSECTPGKESLMESVPLGNCNPIQYKSWVYPGYDSSEITYSSVLYKLSGIRSTTDFIVKSCMYEKSDCTSEFGVDNCEHFNITNFQCRDIENNGYVRWETDSPLNTVVDDDIPPSSPTPNPTRFPTLYPTNPSNHNISLCFAIGVGVVVLAYVVYTNAKSSSGSYSPVPEKEQKIQQIKV